MKAFRNATRLFPTPILMKNENTKKVITMPQNSTPETPENPICNPMHKYILYVN